MSDERINREILSAITKKFSTIKSTEIDIGVVPYIFYQITIRLDENSRIIHSSVKFNDIIGNANLAPKITLEPDLVIHISGTLDELNYLETRKDVSAMLYSKGHTIKTTEISAQARTILDTTGNKSLIGNETFETTRNINSSNSGFNFALNLEMFKFTGGNTNNDNQVKTSNQRIVSRSFVSELVRKLSSGVNISCTSHSSEECNRNIDKVTTFIMDRTKQDALEFKEIEGNNWKLGNDIIGYAQLNKIQIDEVFKTKPAINTDSSDQKNLEVEGIKAGSDTKNKSNFSNDIEWTQKGDTWIPSKVNVHLLDTTNLSNDIDVYLTTKITDESTTTAYAVGFTVLNNYVGALKYDWGLLSSKIKTHFESCTACLPCALPLEYESK